jgi:putative membrane protein
MFSIAGSIALAGTLYAQMPSQGSPQGYPPGQNPGTPNGGNPQSPGMGPQETTPSRPADPTASDKEFAKEAAQGGVAEVELGKLAQEKGSSEGVKQFGARMVQDHSKADQTLREAASAAKIALPTEMAAKDRKLEQKLSKLSGPSFDREYVKLMVSDHKSDVRAFKRESQSGNLPQIREFAANALPTLEEHLSSAEQLAGETKMSRR